MRVFRPAFTLIELLVVVTIIVVLLAILTPAIDRAIYQAELAVCMTRLHGIATGAQVYASDFKRHYPYRPAVVNGSYKANNIYIGSEFATETDPDDRRVLRGYMSVNGHLNDPLTGKVDFESARKESQLEAAYSLWFGWEFRDANGKEPGMYKVGDRFQYTMGKGAAAIANQFDLLASDIDSMDEGTFASGYASHADEPQMMYDLIQQDTASATNSSTPAGLLQYVLTRWQANTPQRGLIDMQFAHENGSIQRILGIKDHTVAHNGQDDRVIGTTLFNDGNYSATAQAYIPKSE